MLYPVELRGQAVSHKEHVVSSKQSIRALPRFLPTFTTQSDSGLGQKLALERSRREPPSDSKLRKVNELCSGFPGI
jgi:hypothetical protein